MDAWIVMSFPYSCRAYLPLLSLPPRKRKSSPTYIEVQLETGGGLSQVSGRGRGHL
jgi:hypothetical protein